MRFFRERVMPPEVNMPEVNIAWSPSFAWRSTERKFSIMPLERR
jgi:hypothetical protein